ncbi:uncharacterized protein adgrf6 [Xiphophorus hellerii]|uniref:uncharacterized protein adgrf6 n=1 Tax=Xiphophorus hellerii TaxID=8084 RepID=UPI0013B41B98|nr:uncharacterized protein LOC116734620 [Xiphophorus hellerii]
MVHVDQSLNSPPDFHQYLLTIELNSTDVTVVEKLRNINNTISMNRNLRISDVNITTVCSPISGDYQCRCEDQYRFPCDQCVTYGSCDNITGDTCGCISGIPAGGQYCQAEDQYNFTACPITTTTPQPTSPPVFHQYLLTIELNSTDVTVVEKLRNISNTISMDRNLQISDVNITTVCSPISGDYQCRCEDQYRFPCDQCVTYGPCDNITGDTCGCISGIPAGGQYCQAEDQYNFTACPITTTTPQPTSPPVFHQYLLSIELNSTDVTVVEKLRNINNTISMNRKLRISDVNITTVCSPISGDYQCRCEDQYRFPCDQCVTYGSCDNITGDTCGCISGIPAGGQYCQAEDQYNFTACPITTTPQPTSPPVFHQYLLSIELNSTDVTVVEKLRNINNTISMNRNLQISDVNITTVCSPISGDYQCRCEDQYRFPCDQCVTYGPCDNITGDTCGCISGIPAGGQYCQAEDQYNFTACPITTTPQPTSPPVFHQYLLTIELNSTDVTVVEKLRNINNTISMNRNLRISDVNITTVCSPISGDYQCRCEDQYRFPCGQCVTYGSCDNITGDTCGCISGIPAGGQYCQAEDQYNFTACPITTTTPQPTIFHQYLLSIELNSTDVTVVEKLRNINNTISMNRNLRISDVNITTVCSPISGDYQCRCEDQYRFPCDQCVTYGSCDNITGDTCGCISGIPAGGQYCQAEDQYNFTACPITTTPQPTSPPVFHQYLLSIELNSTDVTVVEKLRNINNTISMNRNLRISDVNITTVCSPISGDYQCRCEDQYRFPCDQCVTYGSCDNITGDTCGCISGIPAGGQYCQAEDQYNFTACPITTTPQPTSPPVFHQYLLSIELNSTDVTVVEKLRNINNTISMNRNLRISDVNITTVCSPISGDYQCRCEDQYRFPCDQCVTYGPCDNITGDTCGCISGIPAGGQYCQAEDQYNFTACPITTTPQPTSPPVFHQYLLSIELNSTDVTVVEKLRNINNTISMNRNLRISDVNITTVCSPISGDYQCRCEDQYRFPCDQCVTYGSCDNITGDTCGCISGIPGDGQYCQAENQYNFTSCPATTRTPELLVQTEYVINLELNLTDIATVDFLRRLLSNGSNFLTLSPTVNVTQLDLSTVCSPISGDYQCRCEDQYRFPCDQCVTYGSCDNITGDTCGCISGIPAGGQYCQAEDQYNFTSCPATTLAPSPPPVYEYVISIELKAADDEVVAELRNISYPVSINSNIHISDVNISTVCSPISGDYQCRCEDQYRWPCDQCVTYGSCDNITGDTCGCISGIPAGGQYCQAEDQYNFTSCPATTLAPSPPPVYEYVISIELKAADDEVVAELRNISYPVSINSNIQISDVNISTVCSPISGDYQCRCEDQYRFPCDQCVTYGSCDNITGDTCGCISGIPAGGQYCQAEDQYNFTACPITTTPQPTNPPVFHQYLLSIELNSTDVTVVEKLRNINNTISMDRNLRISDVNITTVCSPISGDYQCRCEDQYRFPCDQCVTYGSCDNITGDTCGCISGIPAGGQYCQAEHQYNFTACPITTTPQPTSPPVFHQYLLSIELNSTDVTVVEKLRNINTTISMDRNLRISDVNITTVCSPISGDYQCRCEDQYRFPCDQCVTYGSCDNITGDTCGCISGIPAGGQYCQAEDQYNFTACPITTTPQPTSPPVFHQYLLSIELNSTDVTVVEKLRNINNTISMNRNLRISDVNITTVCSPISGDYQCRCEDQYRFPCDQCVTYGSCDNITGDTCGCISGIPAGGQYCQAEDQYNFTACPITTTPQPTSPPVFHQYLLSIELNSTDVTVVEKLRNINNTISMNRNLRISDVNITTVCSPISGDYQCRCEDQYRFPCDQCVTYGSCDNITGDTCGCISGIPAGGQYCQAEDQYNFTACPITTTPQPTSPPVFHQYLLSIELNSTDVTVVEKLRNINTTISMDRNLRISDVNITTVCSPISGDYHCRCEDQYRFPCDQCVTYGSCDNITGDTCGCISGIPAGGQYCQAEHQYNFTACPITTTPQPTSPPVFHQYLLSIELNSTDVTVVEKLRNINNTISMNRNLRISDVNITTVCSPISGDYQCRCEDQYRFPCDQCVTYGSCDNITGDTCGCISGIPAGGQYCQAEDQYNFTACPITTTPQPTSPPVFHQYLLSIELNSTDVTVVEKLRNINNTISMNRNLRISDVNITTVCSPISGDYQCRCEDQYRFPCDQCVTYGSCDNITGDTCGCISGIPAGGQYCQAEDQYNFTACPITTTPQPTSPPVFHQYLLSIELNSTDVTVVEKLRNINNTISMNRNLRISDVNITTVCSPISGDYQCRCEDQYRFPCDQCVTYGSCDNITGDTCGCISGIPAGGQYCQAEDQYNFTACPITTTPQPTSPPVFHQYLLSIELNSTDVTVVEKLRNINNTISMNRNLRISDVNITTVCSPISGDYQCRCEDQYRFPCDQCVTYGSCDNITGDTCGCISGIPAGGQYCQAEDQYNFTACPITTTPQPTSPPVFHQYLLSIELNSTDVTVVEKLRNINNTISMDRNLRISDVNITTVCSPISGDYQCICEDQYRFPCDQCVTYGSCDNITGDTCGCISGIPAGGQYCQAEDQYNFTACPITTTPQPTSPPVFHQYLLSIELNSTDVTVVERLRNINNTISMNRNLRISDVNITTVCSPISGDYQCRCEDQYRFPCDQCVTYGSCDNITGDTCGCISGIPTGGQYCQAEDQYNFTACPRTSTTVIPTTDTTSPEIRQYLLSFELKTTDVRAVEELRNITSPIGFSSHLLISVINISTVCSPYNTSYQCRCEAQYGWPCDMCSTYGQCNNVQGSTCGCINALLPNNTYCQPLSDLDSCPTQSPTTEMMNTTTPGTTVMNITTPGTTVMNTTTPGTTVLNITTPGTTVMNTTTPGTTVMNTTTPGPTVMNTTTAGTTVVDTTTPGTTVMNITTPGTTVMNTTTPGTTVVDTTIPGPTVMNTTTAGTTVVDTTTPGTTVMNTTTPGTTVMNTTTPGTTVVDTTTPGTTVMNTTTPGTTVMNTTTPGTTVVDTTTPGTTVVDTTTPGTTVMNTTTPGTTVMNTTTPGTTVVDTTTPGTTVC